MKITDKMRLDFLIKKGDSLVMSENRGSTPYGAAVCGGVVETAEMSRENIDAAIRAKAPRR